jgi:RNA polymerase sigma-70 factor (ECF subfamily)
LTGCAVTRARTRCTSRWRTKTLFSSADQEAGEAQRDLFKLLATLPDKQREAIVYTKLDGLSMREAADLLKMSEAAVKVSAHRGLKALATTLREAS